MTMTMKPPKDDSKYSWTNHVWMKMQYYGISEGRIKRIIRFPKRVEEGIAPNTVAVMQPADAKKYSEIWVMYRLAQARVNSKHAPYKSRSDSTGHEVRNLKQKNNIEIFKLSEKKIKIITAWRYPGKSPERDPVPVEILNEARSLL